MRKMLLAFFLILPLIVPAGMIIHHATAKGTQWELPIAGYDPRDLLRGRYILFRYDIAAENFPAHFAVCLNGERTNYDVSVVAPDMVQECDAWVIKTELTKQQRYYIPESIADQADKLVRTNTDRFKALVKIKNGRMQLETLLVDGIKITEFIKGESVE